MEEYSEGLYVAVACNDYPQLWDVTASADVREAQFDGAVAALRATDPDGFFPFTVDEWLASDWVEYTSCLPWPSPEPWVPPLPEPHMYPEVPTLVLVGDLDSITSPEGARQVADLFPGATYLEVPNVGHVTALGDYSRCVSDIAVAFVADAAVGDTGCLATEYQEVRTVEAFPLHLADVVPATGAAEHPGQGRPGGHRHGRRRVPPVAVRLRLRRGGAARRPLHVHRARPGALPPHRAPLRHRHAG